MLLLSLQSEVIVVQSQELVTVCEQSAGIKLALFKCFFKVLQKALKVQRALLGNYFLTWQDDFTEKLNLGLCSL